MSAARVLVVHNSYQSRGGEDSVVDSEVSLLRSMGHPVEVYSRHNHELEKANKAHIAVQALWSRKTVDSMRERMSSFRPDVLHIHNTWPLVSPSAYWAGHNQRIPIVQTLHNFRLLCPQAMFLRDGAVCEECLGRVPWRGVLHACYRGSRAQTTVLTSTLMFHRFIGTWANRINKYIALNEFCKRKFVAGGLPEDKVVVKPNFVAVDQPVELKRSGFLYVGRLSREKGLEVLAGASREFDDISICVIGEGQDEVALDAAHGIIRMGYQLRNVVYEKMMCSMALVVPSIWYETFGLVIVEAFACGLPVIASRIGVIPDLVVDGETGLLFEPGSSRSLAEKLRWANDNPDLMSEMGRRARKLYEEKYTAKRNYEQLLEIYDAAIEEGSR